MDQFTGLKAGTAQIIPEEDFKKKLASGKKLLIKLGADPTAPDLHLGHAVALSKLRQFQDFGRQEPMGLIEKGQGRPDDKQDR